MTLGRHGNWKHTIFLVLLKGLGHELSSKNFQNLFFPFLMYRPLNVGIVNASSKLESQISS